MTDLGPERVARRSNAAILWAGPQTQVLACIHGEPRSATVKVKGERPGGIREGSPAGRSNLPARLANDLSVSVPLINSTRSGR